MKIRQFQWALLVTMLVPSFSDGEAARKVSSADSFRQNLDRMLEKTDKSVGLLRQQIVSSPSAPYAPDLFIQLGETLSQKATLLYYIQMEREQAQGAGSTAADGNTRKFTAVTEAEKEAIEIFERVLRDYPRFERKSKILYLLAVATKSIDDTPKFLGWSGTLLRDFAATEEATKARLLLAQHWFDRGNRREALDILKPVLSAPAPFERNLARYRSGLIQLAEGKSKEALDHFESVLVDEQFREGETPTEVSLQNRQVKSNLKREAIVDSVRAYTNVFPDSVDPVAYYQRVAPNELLFYEAIEKLALRYVSLKRFDGAIKLLRTLTSRTSDPQRVVTVYRDILSSIPTDRRLEIAPDEIRRVLQKQSQWNHFFDVPKEVSAEATAFFERQVRDLGTRSQEISREAKNQNVKAKYLDRAREYYLLYLARYRANPAAKQIATNLAAVYFAQGEYLESAELSLRLYHKEFGPIANGNDVIENVITAAQKDMRTGFYDQLRARGLLVRAIEDHMASSPALRNDPRLNFLLVKTRHEQGMFERSIPALYALMQKDPRSKYAANAGDLILDHFNTRKDYAALAEWSGKMLALNIPDPAFTDRVKKIQQVASVRKLEDVVKAQSGGSALPAGKNYLQTALALEDASMRDAALKLALTKSKEERDLDTFLKTAKALREKEKDAAKRLEIHSSIAKENLRATRFLDGLRELRGIYENKFYPEAARQKAFEESVDVSLLLHDWNGMERLADLPFWNRLSDSMKKRVETQFSDLLDSPIRISPELAGRFLRDRTSEGTLLSAWKAKAKLARTDAGRVQREAEAQCASGGRGALCGWLSVAKVEADNSRYVASISRSPAQIPEVEGQAKALAGLIQSYEALEASGDPHLAMLAMLRQNEALQTFAGFLRSVAKQSPDLSSVLLEKAKESAEKGKAALGRCRQLSSTNATPSARYCRTGETASLDKQTSWSSETKLVTLDSDPASKRITGLQGEIFARGGSEPLLLLAEGYFAERKFSHAAASSLIGLSANEGREGEFRSLLGCSLVQLGFVGEGAFQLGKATPSARTTSCWKALSNGESR